VEKQQKKRFDVLCWNENGAVEIITGILLWRLKPSVFYKACECVCYLLMTCQLLRVFRRWKYVYGLFSLLCIQSSLLFCDIVLLCVTVFHLCIVMFIVRILYCVRLWCTCCYPNWGFSVLFPQL
jgi:hypothetical protein